MTRAGPEASTGAVPQVQESRADGRAPTLLVRLRRDAQLIAVLAPRELKIRYRTSVLDVAWAVISPLAILAVYGYILTQAFGVSSSGAPYLVTTWAGLVVWTFFATSTGTAVSSLISSADLVTKMYFPREVLPLAIVAATLIDLGVGMVILAVLMVAMGVAPTPGMVAVVVPLAVIVVWASALSVLTGVLAAFARDLVHAVHLALRVGFFATPIMYEAAALPSALAWTAEVNPVAVAVEGVRATMFGLEPAWGLIFAQLVAGTVLLAASIVYTRRVEATVVDVL